MPILGVAVAALIAAGTFLESNAVWPRGGLRLQPFTDLNAHGRSVARIMIDSGELDLTIRLDSGAIWPVAGMIFHLASRNQGLDLSAPGTLHLEIGSSSLSSIQTCLVEQIPGFTRDDRWETARYDCQDLDLVPGQSSYDLPLDRFFTPAWWYAKAGVRPSQLGPETRKSVVRFVIQSGDGTPIREARNVRFSRIEVFSTHWVRSLLILAVGCLLSLAQVVRLRTPHAPLPSAARPPVVFQPVEAVSYSDREREAVIQCIATSFSDPELSLEKVSRSTGVPLDRVTAQVKSASGQLFKAYLNRVRVEAARKLLSETDLPVSEIATLVGYGNIPHFNRIFRELVGTTPSGLREDGSRLAEISSATDKPE